jgi:hypothetical protein
MIAECAKCRCHFTVPDEQVLEGEICCGNCQLSPEPSPASQTEAVTQVTRHKFSFEYAEEERPSAAALPHTPPAVASLDVPPEPKVSLATELFGDLNLPDPGSSVDTSSGLLHEAMFELSMHAQTAAVPRPIPVTLQTEARSTFLARQAKAQAEESTLERARGGKGVPARLAQALFGVFLMLLILASFGAYLNDGHLELSSFSWHGFRGLFHSEGDVMAVDVSSGLYDTRAGKQVFYVRGAVENRGSQARRVKVRAEIFDGAQLIRAVEAMAGANYTPEDLYRIEAAADADALNLPVGKARGKVGAGERVPFFLTFYDYPPDLWAYRLKITASTGLSSVAALP